VSNLAISVATIAAAAGKWQFHPNKESIKKPSGFFSIHYRPISENEFSDGVISKINTS
jgi:hypothetical protein